MIKREEAMEKIIKKVKQASFDAFLVQNPDNMSYICHKKGYEIPGLLLVTGEKIFIFTKSRHVEGIRRLYPDYEVISGHLVELKSYCKKLGVKSLGFEAGFTTLRIHKLLEHTFNLALIPVNDFVEDLRMIKSEREIKLLEAVTQLSDQAYLEFLNHIKLGRSEIELKNIFRRIFFDKGADDLSFDILISSGQNTFIPHSKATHKTLEKGDLVLMDFGIKLNGYCSDTTRTLVMGYANEQIEERYNIVLKAQLKALESIRAGMSVKAADLIARDYISERSIGCYDYALGHGIGRTVHEKPRVHMTSNHILQANTAISVEPGIYIEGWGGIRIEDVMIVKEGKGQNLSSAPKDFLILK